MRDRQQHEVVDVRHIASPISRLHGRPNLCGAEQTTWNYYDGLDEAYRAHVEGWHDRGRRVCPECAKVAMIAMGVSNG